MGFSKVFRLLPALATMAAAQPSPEPNAPAPPPVVVAPRAPPSGEARLRMERYSACQRAAIGQDYFPQPAIWKVEDEDSQLYILGTVHALPAGYDWRTPQLDDIVRKAGLLVTETGQIASSERAEVGKALIAPPPGTPAYPPIIDRLEGEAKLRWQGMAAVAPASLVSQLDKMPGWMAAVAISGMLSRNRIALTGGVETQLYRDFNRARKPIEALEDAKSVAEMVNSVPEPVQKAMLHAVINSIALPAQRFDPLMYVHRWGRGEPVEINEDERRFPPELAHRLLDLRNAAWVGRVEKLMARPGAILLAVGASHLHGRNSLLELLEARGLKAVRISPTTPAKPRPAFTPAPKNQAECFRHLGLPAPPAPVR